MTKILKLPELVDQYRMSEMKIRCSRIEAGLDPQRMALLEFLDELRLDDQLAASAFRNFQLFFDIHAVRCNGGFRICADRPSGWNASCEFVGFVQCGILLISTPSRKKMS